MRFTDQGQIWHGVCSACSLALIGEGRCNHDAAINVKFDTEEHMRIRTAPHHGLHGSASCCKSQ